MEYFFDTYAILEIIFGSSDYERFASGTITTNALNLAETYHALLIKYNRATADYWIRRLLFEFIVITPEIAVEASKFRFEQRKRQLSYADCIGWVTSKKHRLKFLTGDTVFEHMAGVEFVK